MTETEKMLTVSNVRVTVSGPRVYRALMGNAEDRGSVSPRPLPKVERQFDQRDWRDLRERLVYLNFQDRLAIADWLTIVGYAPERVLEFRKDASGNNIPVLLDKTAPVVWQISDITDPIADWLQSNQWFMEWLIRLDKTDFKPLRESARRFFIDLQPYKDEDITPEENEVLEQHSRLWDYVFTHRSFPPDTEESKLLDQKFGQVTLRWATMRDQDRALRLEEFLRDIKAPPNIDLQLIKQYVAEGGFSLDRLKSVFHINSETVPTLQIQAESPIEAIAATVVLDREFSARRDVFCKNCKKRFEQRTGRDAYCSDTCRNNSQSRERRSKIQALLDAERAWSDLSADKRKGQDRWKWIIQHASNSLEAKPDIDPAWAKREVEKAHQKKAKK